MRPLHPLLRRAFVLGSALALTTSPLAQPQPPPKNVSPPPASNPAPTIRQFDIATLQKLGVAIHEQDIRVARASDLMMAQKRDWAREGVRGWIVDDGHQSLLVRFFRQLDGKLEAFGDIRFGPGHEPKVEWPEDRTLTPRQLALIRARELAAKNIKRPCSQRYNFVTLPDPGRDGFLVYALAATTDPDAVLAGGHYRFTVSKDGNTIEQADELFRSCLTLSKKQQARAVPQGATPIGLFMTTLIDSTPVETHIFLSLLHNMPFSVGTPDQKVWHIEGGRMTAAKP